MFNDRYANCFAKCKKENRIAFVPFVVIGDPDIETSIAIIKQLIASGADALELGIPFSDPVADGPIIQAATIRALDRGFKMAHLDKVFAAIRDYDRDIPIGLLVYANLVMHQGMQKFIQQCDVWQVDSLLIPDIPAQEADTFLPLLDKHQVQSVFIAPPNATENTLQSVAELSQAYTYVLGRVGITGTHVDAQQTAVEHVETLRKYNAPPLVQGFGISKPEHIQQAAKSGLDGAICGSAIVNLVANSQAANDRLEITLSKLDDFITPLRSATAI